jgi:phage-related protein
MSKFLDTQFSVTGIKNFDITTSYNQYDLVDFEYFTGDAKDPKNLTGLFAWFNIDDVNNLEFDVSGKVYRWYNSAPGHEIAQDLHETENITWKRPVYNQNNNCIVFSSNLAKYEYNNLYTTGDTNPGDSHFKGFSDVDRCWFIVYEFNDLKRGDYGYTIFPNISAIVNTFHTGALSYGFIGVTGNNEIYSWNNEVPKSSQQFTIDVNAAAKTSPATLNSAFSSAKPLKNKNILSIIKNNTSNSLILRNNGFKILDTTSSTFFPTGATSLELGIGRNTHTSNNQLYNYDASNISYYEILGFSKVPTDNDILSVEKYLFEKHFTNDDGLYIATQNFIANNYNYAPINISGSNYLTKNIDSLFNKTYGCSASFSTKAQRMNYGDSYVINVIPNINNLNSEFILSYDGLTDKQAKSLIGFFQNTFEYAPKNIVESYESVNMDLFFPYKNNAKIYFSDLQYNSVEANLNKIDIKCFTSYDSSLDYRGFLVTGENVTRSFQNNKKYNYNDVVYFDSIAASERGYYWFTGADNTFVTNNTNPTGANTLFTRSFYFKPDLNFDVSVNPKFIKTEYDTSAASFENYGINKTSLELSFNYNNRSDKEAEAILKFLDSNAGFKIFEMRLPEPYNKLIDVYCPEWNHSYKFKNNHDITVKFIEFKGKTDSDIFFNTLLSL